MSYDPGFLLGPATSADNAVPLFDGTNSRKLKVGALSGMTNTGGTLSVDAATTAAAGKVQIATTAVIEAAASSTQALTPAQLAAAKLIVADILLGGQVSAKSAINARGPAQGLVFDGTAGASATLPSVLSGNQTLNIRVLIPSTNPAASSGLLQIGGNNAAANTLGVYITSAGALFVVHYGATGSDYISATYSALVATFGGKYADIVLIVTSGVMAARINGVTVTLSEGTGGTPPLWSADLATTELRVGRLTTNYYTGSMLSVRAYNRSLTAAEVLALAESGVPAASDYNSASNTALNTVDALNTYGSPFSTFATTPTSLTASHNTETTNVRIRFPLLSAIVSGKKYRVSGTLTVAGMTSGSVTFGNTSYSATGGTVMATIASGYTAPTAFSVEVTASAAATDLLFSVTTTGSVEAHSVTLTGLSVTPLGLLLAPDAAAPGNGYQWHDQSGNGAHIILPASGVTWALPTKQGNYVAGTTNTAAPQLLCAASTLLPALCRITSITMRSRSGTPTITLGTASGGAQLVASVALSTTWQNMTVALAGGIVTTADDVWVGSDSTDTVETRINYEMLSF